MTNPQKKVKSIIIFWLFFFLLPVAAFEILDLHLDWLDEMRLPVSFPLDLEKDNWTVSKDISGSYIKPYLCGLGVTFPTENNYDHLDDSKTREQLVNDLGKVNVKIEITEHDGTKLVDYQGALIDWSLMVPPGIVEDYNAMFYHWDFFNPSLFKEYKLKIIILQGEKGANGYNPTIFFYQYDVYFWVTRYISKRLTGIGVVIFWVILLRYRKRKKKELCKQAV